MALPEEQNIPEENKDEFYKNAFAPVQETTVSDAPAFGGMPISDAPLSKQQFYEQAFTPVTPEMEAESAVMFNGRPTAMGANVPYDPATTRALSPSQKLDYLQQYAQADNIGLNGLDENTLTAVYNYTRMLERDGYKPEFSSAHRPHGNPRSAHYSGMAIDQPYLKRIDGKPLTVEQEIALSKKYARMAGFVTFGDEMNNKTADWTGQHIHLSMTEDGLGAPGFERLNATKGQNPRFDKKTVVSNIAQAVGIDRPDLLVRQLQLESGFDPDAVSPAGALGIAQMMPGTLAEVGKKYGFTAEQYATNPTLQVRAGALHMKDLLQKHGNYAQALAAYNAGSGGLDNAIKTGRIPEETLNYVSNILQVPQDRARDLILNGNGFTYNETAARAQAAADDNAYVTAIRDFIHSGVDEKVLAVADAARRAPRETLEFGREIAHGMTLGLSEFIPGLATTSYFNKYKKNANIVERAAMGIPWLLGSIVTGEILAAGFGATNVMGFAAKSGFARPVSPTVTGAYSVLQGILNKSPNQAASALGRMIIRGEQTFTNTVAQTGAFALQGAITAATAAISDPKKSGSEVVIDALSGALSGGAFGLAFSVGVPLVWTGGVTALNVAPGLGKALNPLNALPAGARAAAESVGASAALGGAVVGGGAQFLSNVVTGEDGGKLEAAAAGAAAGALGAFGFRHIPPALQSKIRDSVTTFWNSLDSYQKQLWTASVMEGVTNGAATGNAISKEMERKAVRDLLTESSERFGQNIDNQKVMLQGIRAEEQALVEKVRLAQENMQMATQAAGPENVAAFESLLERQGATANAVQDFIARTEAQPKVTPSQKEELKRLQKAYQTAEKEVAEAAKDPATAYYYRLRQAASHHANVLENFRMSPRFANIGKMDEAVAQLETFKADIDKMNAGIKSGDLDVIDLPRLNGPWENIEETLTDFDLKAHEGLHESMQRWNMEVAQKGFGLPDDLLHYSQAYYQSIVDPAGSARLALEDTISSLRRQIARLGKPEEAAAAAVKGKKAATDTAVDFATPPNVFNVTQGVPRRAVEEAQRRGSPLFWNAEEFRIADTPSEKRGFWGKRRDDKTVWVDAQTYLSALERQNLLIPNTDKAFVAAYNKIKKAAREGRPVGYKELNLRSDAAIHVYGTDSPVIPARSQALAKIMTELGGGLMPIRVHPAAVDPLRDIIRAERKLGIEDRIRGLENLLEKARATRAAQRGGIQQAAESLANGRDPLNLSQGGITQSIKTRMAREIFGTPATNDMKTWESAMGEAEALWLGMAPEQHRALQEAELHDLLTLFENRNTPSAYKRAIELEGVVSDEKIRESAEMLDTLLGRDREAAAAMKEWINYARSENPKGMDWRQDAFGQTQAQAEQNLYNVRRAAVVVANSLSTRAREAFDAVVAARNLDPEAAKKLTSELTYAMEDPNKRLSAYIKENPDLAPIVAGLLDMQGAIEKFSAWAPELKAYTRAHYLHHSHPNIAAFMQAADNRAVASETVRLATEQLRKFNSVEEKKRFTESAYAFLTKDIGMTKDKWFALTEDGRRAKVKETFTDLTDDLDIDQRQKDITSGILLENPLETPWDMVSAQIQAVMGSTGARRFMNNLPEFFIDTGVEGVPPSPLLIVLDEGADIGSLPRVANRFQGRGKMTEESRYTAYIPVDSIETMRGMTLTGKDGKEIPSYRLAIYPDAADFMMRYWSSTRMGVMGESVERVNSILSDTALRGSPLTHIWNMVQNSMAAFALAPLKGLGIPSVGRALMDQNNGHQLLLNAIYHGVNIRTFNQSTRLWAQEALSLMDAKQIEESVGRMSTGQKIIESLDPSSPSHAAAMQSIEKLPLWQRAAVKAVGFIPKVDQLINRATLFEIIEKMQLGMFYFKAGEFYKRFEVDPAMAGMPKSVMWRDAQRAAAEFTNRITGAGLPFYHSSKARQMWEIAVLTPSWWRAKVDMFMATLEGMGVLGIAGGAGENIGKFGPPKLKRSMFAHYPPAVRVQMANQMRNMMGAIMVGGFIGNQAFSIAINGRTTMENGKENVHHIQYGDAFYTSPFGGMTKNIARTLTGIAGGDVEAVSREIGTLFAPHLTMPIALMQNMDPFTRQPIYRPSGDTEGQLSDVTRYATSQYINTEEILGVKKGADALGILGLSPDGTRPVRRLNDRQWFAKLMGMHEKRFDRPRIEEAKFKTKISYYEKEHTRHVRELLTAANQTDDPKLQSALEGQAYKLAITVGKADIRDPEVTKYLPDGILRMTPDEFIRLYKEVNTPSEALILGRNNNPARLSALLERLESDRWIKMQNAAKAFLHPGDGDT